jgi:tetratricopeptide (TPR) repeat protein
MRRLFFFLAATLFVSSADAQPRWTLIESGTLTVIGDRAGTARDLATEIEQFRAVVGGVVGTTQPPATPTVAYVFGTRRAMAPYLPLYNGRPLEAAGLYAPDVDVNRIIISAEERERSTPIAYHEYTHLLAGNAVSRMPTWLGEGIAEFFSTFQLTMGGRSAEAGHPIVPHILLLREQFVPIMELLEATQASRLYNEGDRRSIFYAEAWALTHFILTQLPDGRAAINRYVTGVNSGAPPAAAVRAAFGTTPADLEARLRQYVRREVFSMTRFELARRVDAGNAAARTLTVPEAEAWLADLQRAVHGPEAAAARIEKAAAAAPDAAIAQLALGRLRARQHRPDEARSALARAAASAPDDFMMQLAHGMWLSHAGGVLVPTDAAVASLRRAVALRPESADAHAWLGVNLMAAPATRGDARAALERAIGLAPGRLDYLVHLADLYLLDDLFAPARVLLSKVAADTADDTVRAAAADRLADIAAREARLALARRLVIASPPAAAGGTSAPRPERPEVVTLSGVRGAFAATNLVHAVTGETLALMMRRPQAGEERLFATLTTIECRQGPELRFHLTDGSRTIVATAGRFPDIELTALRPGELLLGCGRRTPADRVALTFRPAANRAGVAGTVVAIEFLPDGYGPG